MAASDPVTTPPPSAERRVISIRFLTEQHPFWLPADFFSLLSGTSMAPPGALAGGITQDDLYEALRLIGGGR